MANLLRLQVQFSIFLAPFQLDTSPYISDIKTKFYINTRFAFNVQFLLNLEMPSHLVLKCNDINDSTTCFDFENIFRVRRKCTCNQRS